MNRIQNWGKLCEFLERIVHEVTDGNAILIADILNRHKKSQPITKMREKILDRVRKEIWELHKHSHPGWDVVMGKPPTKAWRPLGYLSIAQILGGDHSAWVKMATKMRTDNVRDTGKNSIEVNDGAGESADCLAASER